MWHGHSRVVVFDVDGTITLNDGLGHVGNVLDQSFIHPGVCEFLCQLRCSCSDSNPDPNPNPNPDPNSTPNPDPNLLQGARLPATLPHGTRHAWACRHRAHAAVPLRDRLTLTLTLSLTLTPTLTLTLAPTRYLFETA